jgi:hypothetical protein
MTMPDRLNPCRDLPSRMPSADGLYDLTGEEDNIGRNYFARSPGSDVWVSFHDLPAAVCDRLWTRMKAGDFDGHREEVPF